MESVVAEKRFVNLLRCGVSARSREATPPRGRVAASAAVARAGAQLWLESVAVKLPLPRAALRNRHLLVTALQPIAATLGERRRLLVVGVAIGVRVSTGVEIVAAAAARGLELWCKGADLLLHLGKVLLRLFNAPAALFGPALIALVKGRVCNTGSCWRRARRSKRIFIITAAATRGVGVEAAAPVAVLRRVQRRLEGRLLDGLYDARPHIARGFEQPPLAFAARVGLHFPHDVLRLLIDLTDLDEVPVARLRRLGPLLPLPLVLGALPQQSILHGGPLRLLGHVRRAVVVVVEARFRHPCLVRLPC
mmetsp:Transcript_24634/g.77218  ORF Transcript_24634/g.77218 Transcript_24634/m.77218 type:complete len:307 (-) Transcript_24634:1868-2788(-)